MIEVDDAPERPAVQVPLTEPSRGVALLTRGHRMWTSWSHRLTRWQARVPRVLAVVRVVYLPVALLLVGYIGYRAAQKVDLSTVRVGPLVGAYALSLVWWLALACGWSTLLTERVSLAPIRAWCQTQVMRYLPGGIWAPIARAATVRGRVRDKAAAVLAENVTVLAAATGVAALWVTVHSPYWLPLAGVIALPTIGARWLERRTKVARTAVMRTTGVYVVGYVIYGLAAILTQVAVSGVRHPTYPLYVAGAACAAWAIGLVVVFAPGGVGVREVVYVWMLRGLYPRAELQVAAVTSRLVTVFAELTVLAAVSAPLWRRRKVAASSVSASADTIAAQAGTTGEASEGQASEGPDSRW